MQSILVAALALTPLMAQDDEPAKRLELAAVVLADIMAAPDKGTPEVGFQIGGSTTDLIMLVMSERGAEKLISSSFTLGGEGSVAAGPVGRTATAQTDAQMHADILSWSRSQGIFAGLSLQRATLRQDLDDNKTIYGEKLENRDIVTKEREVPAVAANYQLLKQVFSARKQVGAKATEHD